MAYGGTPVKHNGLHPEIFARIYPGVTEEKFVAMYASTQAQITEQSRKIQQEEYITCLLLWQLSNANFSGLKMKLADKLLVGGKNAAVCPSTLCTRVGPLPVGPNNMACYSAGPTIDTPTTTE